MADAMSKPLSPDEQKLLLTRYEQLINTATEIEMIFDRNAAQISKRFVVLFADLLKAMYRLQVYMTEMTKSKNVYRDPGVYYKGCEECARKLGIFTMRNELMTLAEKIYADKIFEKMKKSIYLK